MWLELPKGWRVEGHGAKEDKWCHLQCNYSDLNVRSLIFFKKLCKFHSVGVLSQDLCQQNEF